jgi:hypothetical protein
MRKVFYFLLLLPSLLSAQIQSVKSNQITVGVNFTPVNYYFFDHDSQVKTSNKYNFQTGIEVGYYKTFRKNMIGFTTGLVYGTKNFIQENSDTSLPLFNHSSHQYAIIKIPLTIEYFYKINKISIGSGFGLNLNYFLKGLSTYECVYNNGNTVNEFPEDLEFESFREFVAFISFVYFFHESKMSIEVRPFITHNLSDPMFFSQEYYNLGKTMIGLNLVFKRSFKLKKINNENN